jgi:hypothetical protein
MISSDRDLLRFGGSKRVSAHFIKNLLGHLKLRET